MYTHQSISKIVFSVRFTTLIAHLTTFNSLYIAHILIRLLINVSIDSHIVLIVTSEGLSVRNGYVNSSNFQAFAKDASILICQT